jgi:DNA-binding transcriptional MerR regulator
MDRWMKLIKQFEENGYKPQDIQRIVMVYEMTKENDELLKKTLEADNEHNH